MNVAIVKYNAGNIRSVANALRRLGVEPIVTSSCEELSRADRVIFPGQGEARSTMQFLKAHQLDQAILALRQPVLAICIGMQLLCQHSEEGDTDCMGVFDADVRRFRPSEATQKVPQMGWNSLKITESETKNSCKLLAGLPPEPYVYFVHSYYVPLCRQTIAETDYILPYSAALQKGNFFATQFHPEKSGAVGDQILRNFLEINQ